MVIYFLCLYKLFFGNPKAGGMETPVYAPQLSLTPSVGVPSSHQKDFQSAPAWLPPGNSAQLGMPERQTTYITYPSFQIIPNTDAMNIRKTNENTESVQKGTNLILAKAATCGHLLWRPLTLAATCSGGHLRPLDWLQVAASGCR